MKLLNHEIKYFKAMGILVIISLLHFIFVNILMYMNVWNYFSYEILEIGSLGHNVIGLIYGTIFAMSLLGFSLCLIFRYFPHGCIPGLFLFFIMLLLDSNAYLHLVYTPLIIVYKLGILYFLAKTRFCDYNESKLTSIFK